MRRGKDVHPIGLSAVAPGAYAEQLLVEESLTVPVPNRLAPELAARTEPMAVGWHAVRRGEVKKGTVAFVIGCGPIGLAVISMLKASGVRKRRRERLLRGAAEIGEALRREPCRRPGRRVAVRRCR